MPSPRIASALCRMNDVGDVLAKARDRERIEALASDLDRGPVGQARECILEDVLNERLGQVDLEVVEQTREVVFRGGHECALDVDHDQSGGDLALW